MIVRADCANRPLTSALLAFGLLTVGAGCGDGVTRATPVQPNVLLYVVDTLRADTIGAYGNRRVTTPSIDDLAAEGVLFENAFANSSWTRPSVASVFTGRYPTRHGVRSQQDPLPGGVTTLAEILSGAGFTTGFVNTNPNVGSFFGFDRGFAEVIELYDRRTAGAVEKHELITASDEVTPRALEWLAGARRPFFLVVHTIDPHSPYTPPARFDRYGGDYRGEAEGRWDWIKGRELSESDRARIRSLYYGEVSFNDDSFGALVEGLRSLELLEDTLVIFTSDHGEELWEEERLGHGQSLSDIVTRVPLILRLPAALAQEAGRRISHPVELVDIVPTILDILDLPQPEGLDGRRLLAPRGDPDRILFSNLVLAGYELRAARQYPFKLVRDMVTGEDRLLDLNAGGGEIELDASAAHAHARQRLEAALAAVADRATAYTAAEARTDAKMPEDVEAALRELGYLDGAEPDEPEVSSRKRSSP